MRETIVTAVKKTALGRKEDKANSEAEAARVRANQSKDMEAVMQAYQAYQTAEQERRASASPEQRERLKEDQMRCIETWSELQMKKVSEDLK
jgi:hypothetical protein